MVNRLNVPRTPKICPKYQPVAIPVQKKGEDGVLKTVNELHPVLCFLNKCEWFCEEHQMCLIKCKHMVELHGYFECFGEDEDCECL